MGPCIRNGVGPDAANDTRNALQYPNVNVTDVREIAPRLQARNAPRSHTKATMLWRPSDGTHSRPITRTGLRSLSDDPRRPTWGRASEMVSARVLLTTQRRVTAPPEERLRNRRSNGRATLASKECAQIKSKSNDALASERRNA